MSIIHVDQKRTLSIVHYTLIFLGALLVAAYVFWPETPHRAGVVLSKEAKLALITQESVSPLVYPNTLNDIVIVSENIDADHTGVERVQKNEDEVTEGRVLPPYGAAAIGSEGAWDGKGEDGSVGKKGSTCIDSETLDTSQLRELSRTRNVCGYQDALGRRRDIVASDLLYLLDNGFVVDNLHIEYGVRDGWTVADFEGVALGLKYGFTLEAEFELYLLLKKNGSPLAQVVHDKWSKQGIEEDELVKMFARLCGRSIIPADVSASFC